MFIYALQSPPDIQEAPDIFEDGANEMLAIFGNTHFKEHIPDFVQAAIRIANSDLTDEYRDNVLAGAASEQDMAAFIRHDFSVECAQAEIQKMLLPDYDILIAKRIIETSTRDWLRRMRQNMTELVCLILSAGTGNEWTFKELRGSCQSDWNGILYPTNLYTPKDIEGINTIYWNEGAEWYVITSEEPIAFQKQTAAGEDNEKDVIWIDSLFNSNKDPWNESICVYTVEPDEDKIRENLKIVMDLPEAKVILLKFKGYHKVPAFIMS